MEWIVRTAMPYVLGMLIVVVYLFTKNKKVGLVALLGMAGSAVATACYGKAIIDESRAREGVMVDMSQKINNSLDNMKNIYINNQANTNKDSVEVQNQHHAQKASKELALGLQMKASVTAVTFVALAVIVYLVYRDTAQAGKASRFEGGAIILIFVSYVGWLRSLLFDMPFVFHRMGVLENSREFLEDIFQEKAVRRNLRGGIDRAAFEFRDVTFYFEEGRPILERFSYTFLPQTMTCVTGKSGTGKSVTMQMLIGLFHPKAGTVLVDGTDLRDFDPEYLRERVIYVNQRDDMFEESVRYNMLFGKHKFRKRLRGLLEKYAIAPMYAPVGGLDAGNVGANGANLSNGMRKMIVVVRTLWTTPPPPTSSTSRRPTLTPRRQTRSWA